MAATILSDKTWMEKEQTKHDVRLQIHQPDKPTVTTLYVWSLLLNSRLLRHVRISCGPIGIPEPTVVLIVLLELFPFPRSISFVSNC